LRKLLLLGLRLLAMKIRNLRDQPTYFRALARVNGRETMRFLRRRNPLCVIDHVVDRVRKFLHARARDYDGVTAPMGLLGDAKELAAIVLAEFHVEVLAFDLHFPRIDEIIHVPKKPRSLGRFSSRREAVFLD